MKSEQRDQEKRTTVLRRLLNEPGCVKSMIGGNAHHAMLTEAAGIKIFFRSRVLATPPRL